MLGQNSAKARITSGRKVGRYSAYKHAPTLIIVQEQPSSCVNMTANIASNYSLLGCPGQLSHGFAQRAQQTKLDLAGLT